ncbi:hypothetical protein JW899_00775 [Candidatus Uhrbacteria bacterium]|nr:hypothetical protein [Candidatus Uhrbacteria bacterium]
MSVEKVEKIEYPFLPEGREIRYVGPDDRFMAMAKDFARSNSLDRVMPGAAVVVRDDVVLGIGANGSDYHRTHGCKRVALGCRTGEGYDLCEGCHPKNHSEASAIREAQKNGHDTAGADLYLWGHWWCCQPCWEAMVRAGISRVFLLEGSEILFNKDHPGNIVGRQFE